ncbi:MAG: Rieske 2Fe-2S domain-containing protein [Planctomycetaceae bacterium]|nr:Rieske 2Fe-2S domain-containing protein [Planctomycetaceae bacterium]
MSNFVTVCKIDEIPVGEARMFVIEGTPVGVFHIDDHFYALHNECPHAGASLAHGSIDGDVVSCRIHHWRFCLRDGTYLDQDQPKWNAQTIPVRVVGDEVQLEF